MEDREGFDHLIIGKQLIHFVYPPFGVPDTTGYESGLKEIIPLKLRELLSRTNFLKERRNLELRSAIITTQRTLPEEYLLVSLAFHKFSEYYVIQKWLNYWVQLWYKINPNSLPPKLSTQLNFLSEEDIKKSKQNPIQNYYQGQLRHIGSRLVGLCPLHEEKTASFNIYLEINTFHCYGCQAHGDSISFIQQTKNLSFPEAVRYLL